MLDQGELEWFLSFGITLFERSTTGAILDKIAMDAFTSRRCHVCDGGGIITKSFSFRANGRSPIAYNSGDWCFRCGGTGAIPVRLTPEEQALVNSGDQRARETDSYRAAVPDESIARYAVVSRRLSRMPRSLAVSLAAAYGDEGSECALTPKGRAWAVTPYTSAGRKLLEQERRRKARTPGVEPERPVRALLALAALDANRPSPDRTALLADASVRSMALLEQSERAWVRVSIEDGRSKSLRRWIQRACQEVSYG